jgi:hypothetical protein
MPKVSNRRARVFDAFSVGACGGQDVGLRGAHPTLYCASPLATKPLTA